MLFCLGRRKLATLLSALCLIGMLMSINKYLSDDKNNRDDNAGEESKMKAYYPFDDTGQLRNHQHLNNAKNSFKAWQVNSDETDGDSKNSNIRNVIQAPMNGDNVINDNNVVEREVVIRDFNNHKKKSHYAFQNVDLSLTTTEDYLNNRGTNNKDSHLHDNENMQIGNNKAPVIDIPDPDIPVISPDGQRYIPRQRVVHLDLKGAPPLMSYLKSILPLLKEAGATALLVEYEDMFPYWGRLKNIAAKNAYSVEDIKKLKHWALKYGLMIIPLVQTFGHLEHALKLADFYDLREVSAYPQSLCPSRNGSWYLVKEMIDQMTELHPEARWLHIGCDEVFQLGMCSICTERLMKFNSDPEKISVNGVASGYMNDHSLFLQHVHRVASYVVNKKGLIPIIWDDMLRKIQSEKLIESGIGKLVEPMVWVYVEDIDRFIYSFTWSTYAEVFPHIWTASAYKGAFGEQLYIVNVARHVYNNLAWLDVMKRETLGPEKLNFRGIVLTGWSRYDHFAILCELLPASIPSLVLNLVICSRGAHDEEAGERASRILQCPSVKSPLSQTELMHSPEQLSTASCKFPGANILSLLSAYKSQVDLMKSAYERVDEREGWMTEYNVKHKFSSPWRVREAMQSIGIGDYLMSTLETFQDNFVKSLSLIYDKYTVDEWMEQHIGPLMKMLTSLMQRAQTLTNSDIWARRPLNFDKLSKSSKSVSADNAKEKNLGSHQDKISNDQADDGLNGQNKPSKRIESDIHQNQDGSFDPRNEEDKTQENDLLRPSNSLQRSQNKKLLSLN